MHSVRLTEWLNANSSRAFPFVETGSLPQDVVVDARLVFFKEQPGEVQLVEIESSAGSLRLDFTCGGTVYSVSVILEDSMYQRVLSETTEASFYITLGPGTSIMGDWTGAIVVEPACTLFPRLVGYMGALDDIPVDPGNTDTEMEVFDNLKLALSFDRPYLLDGDIKIEGGYGVQVSVSGNTITLAAVPGYGDRIGYPCFKVHGSTSLDGAIVYVNGLTPDSFGNLDIESGDGIRLAPVTEGGTSYLYVKSPVSSTKARCKKV